VTPRARYALAELLRLLDVPGRELQAGREGLSPSGTVPFEEIAARLPPPRDGNWDETDPDPRLLSPPARLGDFDLLYATYTCLTAPWERVDPVDEVGCPIAAEGWLARHALLEQPLVHRYAALLGEVLGAAPKREAAVVLTHDVDEAFERLFGRRERWERLRRQPSLRRAASLARSIVLRGGDPDLFEAWMERPTFFFAARGLLEGGDERDVAYDIGHPRVRETIRRLADRGAEIGVHFSIASAGSAEHMRAERERLEQVAGVPVRSSRHHWWALPTGPAHATAGVEVDLSLGFNDRPGFRRGIAAPFRPYDHDVRRAADVWALPTLAMDAAVRTADELATLWDTVRTVGGLLVLDWHVHSANPRSGLPYQTLLDFLHEAEPPLRTPLEAVA
jgi:hypothetical protein